MQEEYLPTTIDGMLDHIIEECAELIKECSKAKRFGLESKHPDAHPEETNLHRIMLEEKDVACAVGRLVNLAKDPTRAARTQYMPSVK